MSTPVLQRPCNVESDDMPWHCRYIPDIEVIETPYESRVSLQELLDAQDAEIALGREKGTRRFLSDCSRLEGGHSIMDQYALVDRVYGLGVSHVLAEAILVPAAEAVLEMLKFRALAAQNRGYAVRLFTRRDEALAWLSEAAPGNV
jgi:hypothetical protein